MNRLIFSAATAAALALSMPVAAQAQRAPNASIVVVDVERIYRECTACRAAQTQIQAMATSLQQRQQQLVQPLQAEMQSLQQAAQAARNQTGAARTTAETQIQQRLQALQQREEAANRELQQAEQNIRSTQAHVAQQLNVRLEPIVNQVMNARGANIVLPVSATLARSGALDVTNDVLGALNQQLPSVTVTPLPQQQQQQQPQGR